jgi:hypothetical protein
MRIRWSLVDPAVMLPPDVDQISVDVFVGDETEPDNSIYTVANLPDNDMNGRRELVRGGLPVGVPIRITITGLSGGAPRYIGHAGPFVLRVGERRYVEPAMFPLNQVQQLERGPAGRFLHTATPLPDGRVLVAGGFDVVSRGTCPADIVAESRCYAVRATRDAFVYDPATARFYPVRSAWGRGGMLQPRAGHTATPLPDGRVLIAGGAEAGLLAFVPQGDPRAPRGFEILLDPQNAAGARVAHATFEIFDPEANPEEEDVEADGDPGRGGFVGAADDPGQPGRLDRGRFLAAAAPILGSGRVLIAGGTGSPGAERSYAVFDADRPGGYGVYGADTMLQAARVGATAVAAGTAAAPSVWIFGGAEAGSNADLVEVWTETMRNRPTGATASASTAPLRFPGEMRDRPEWSLWRPLVETVSNGTRALVVGWYGPQCVVGMPMSVVFAGGAEPTERCGFLRTGPTRSYTVELATGVAIPTMVRNPHALGASARLDDGRVLVSGGLTSIIWEVNNTIDVFTGGVDGAGAAQMSSLQPTLRVRRALHTATPLPDRGMLVLGGINFPDPGLTRVQLVGAAEVIYLGR